MWLGNSCADPQSAFLLPSYGRYHARPFFNQFSTALALKSLIEFTKRFDFSPRSMWNTLHRAVSGFDKQRNVGCGLGDQLADENEVPFYDFNEQTR